MKKISKEKLSAVLNKQLISFNMTNEELAKELNMQCNVIENIENGSLLPDFSDLYVIMDYMKIDWESILEVTISHNSIYEQLLQLAENHEEQQDFIKLMNKVSEIKVMDEPKEA